MSVGCDIGKREDVTRLRRCRDFCCHDGISHSCLQHRWFQGRVLTVDGSEIMASLARAIPAVRLASSGSATRSVAPLGRHRDAVRMRGGLRSKPVAATALVAVLFLLSTPPVAVAPISFTGPTDFAAGTGPASVAVGDFDADNDTDLAVANASVPGGVSVLLNDGTGNFGAPTSYVLPNGSQSVVVGQLNGDGDLDLVIANSSGTVSVLLGQAGGTFGLLPKFLLVSSRRQWRLGISTATRTWTSSSPTRRVSRYCSTTAREALAVRP